MTDYEPPKYKIITPEQLTAGWFVEGDPIPHQFSVQGKNEMGIVVLDPQWVMWNLRRVPGPIIHLP